MLIGRRSISGFLAALALAMPSLSSAAAPQGIFGNWLTDDHSAIIAIEKCGHALCGKIEQILDPKAPANDINNPDVERRSHPLVGTLILRDFVASGTSWTNGSAYDPKVGRSYRSSLAMQEDGKLKVTGCVLFVCRSRYWVRATK